MEKPVLEGYFTMEDTSGGAWKESEMFSYAATNDEQAQQKLMEHIRAERQQVVGNYDPESCPVFNKTTRFLLGRVAAGQVFRVGHGASRDVLPQVIYDSQMEISRDVA